MSQDANATLKPAFSVSEERPDEPVVVVFAANDYYAPYLSALMASILAHRAQGRRYDLIVLSEDFSEAHRRVLVNSFSDDDTSLRFLDVTGAMRPYRDKLRVWAHFKVETYFRLLLPQLLPDYAKVLYLDADMICLADVAELFDTDVEGRLVAACKDPDTAGIYNGVNRDVGQPDKQFYMDNTLGIRHPYEYFQAGTLIFNLDEWRRCIRVEDVFAFAQREDWQLLDQDVLNWFCQGRCAFLDMSWNVMFDLKGFRVSDIISQAPEELREAYREAHDNPRIVHYAGDEKPWDNPECDFAEHYWRYARRAPFYEVALERRRARALGASEERAAAALAEVRELAVAALAEGEAAVILAQEALDESARLRADLEAQIGGLPSERAQRLAYERLLAPAARLVRSRSEGAYQGLRSMYRALVRRS